MVRRVYRGYSPWREMRRMQRQMDRLMNSSGAGLAVAPSYPAMNVWINEDGAIVTAELPGFDPDALDISVVNDTLTLSGNRCADEAQEATYHRRERRCGKFTRSFQLPFLVEGTDVEAATRQRQHARGSNRRATECKQLHEAVTTLPQMRSAEKLEGVESAEQRISLLISNHLGHFFRHLNELKVCSHAYRDSVYVAVPGPPEVMTNT